MSLPTPALTRGTFHATLLSLLCIAEPVHSEPRLEGRFQGRGEGLLSLQVFALDEGGIGEEHFVVAGTAVPNECTGEVRGIARRIDPTTLRLRKMNGGSEDTCEVTLRYSPDRNGVTMSAQSCNDYRGMSCDFEGTLKRR